MNAPDESPNDNPIPADDAPQNSTTAGKGVQPGEGDAYLASAPRVRKGGPRQSASEISSAESAPDADYLRSAGKVVKKGRSEAQPSRGRWLSLGLVVAAFIVLLVGGWVAWRSGWLGIGSQRVTKEIAGNAAPSDKTPEKKLSSDPRPIQAFSVSSSNLSEADRKKVADLSKRAETGALTTKELAELTTWADKTRDQANLDEKVEELISLVDHWNWKFRNDGGGSAKPAPHDGAQWHRPGPSRASPVIWPALASLQLLSLAMPTLLIQTDVAGSKGGSDRTSSDGISILPPPENLSEKDRRTWKIDEKFSKKEGLSPTLRTSYFQDMQKICEKYNCSDSAEKLGDLARKYGAAALATKEPSEIERQAINSRAAEFARLEREWMMARVAEATQAAQTAKEVAAASKQQAAAAAGAAETARRELDKVKSANGELEGRLTATAQAMTKTDREVTEVRKDLNGAKDDLASVQGIVVTAWQAMARDFLQELRFRLASLRAKAGDDKGIGVLEKDVAETLQLLDGAKPNKGLTERLARLAEGVLKSEMAMGPGVVVPKVVTRQYAQAFVERLRLPKAEELRGLQDDEATVQEYIRLLGKVSDDVSWIQNGIKHLDAVSDYTPEQAAEVNSRLRQIVYDAMLLETHRQVAAIRAAPSGASAAVATASWVLQCTRRGPQWVLVAPPQGGRTPQAADSHWTLAVSEMQRDFTTLRTAHDALTRDFESVRSRAETLTRDLASARAETDAHQHAATQAQEFLRADLQKKIDAAVTAAQFLSPERLQEVAASVAAHLIIPATGPTAGPAGPARPQAESPQGSGDILEAQEYFSRGLEAFFAGRLTDAAGKFVNAIHNDPRNATYRYYLGLSFHRIGREQDAVSQVQIGRRLEAVGWHADTGRFLERVQGGERMWLEETRLQM